MPGIQIFMNAAHLLLLLWGWRHRRGPISLGQGKGTWVGRMWGVPSTRWLL